MTLKLLYNIVNVSKGGLTKKVCSNRYQLSVCQKGYVTKSLKKQNNHQQDVFKRLLVLVSCVIVNVICIYKG